MLKRALVLLLWLWPALALAETYPRPLSDRVSDFADLLTPDQETALDQRLKDARKDTGVHLVVVTIPSRASIGFGGTGLEPFATGLFNSWGVGDDLRDDGVMILVLPKDREMRIELGEGFPKAYDRVAQEVIDTAFLPAFRSGSYASGILDGTEETIARIALPFAGKAPLTSPPKGGLPMLLWAGLASVVALVLGVGGKIMLAMMTCKRCGKRELERSTIILRQPTSVLSGEKEVTTRCRACGNVEVHSASIAPYGRDNDRSGGSGFGGGRSSGGGASGRW